MNMCNTSLYTFRSRISIHEQKLWFLTVQGASATAWWTPALSVSPLWWKNSWARVHVRVFICSSPANLHWSDLSNSLGDSISTVTRFWLELEGLWYRPWTGTVASRFPERKTSAVKPEDRYSGASRSTFESRRTYKTCPSSSQLKCKVNKYSYEKYWKLSPPNRCLVLEFPADIHPCKLHLAAFGPVKLSHHDLLFPTEHCTGDPYKPNTHLTI